MGFPSDHGRGCSNKLAKDLCIDAGALASLSEIMQA